MTWSAKVGKCSSSPSHQAANTCEKGATICELGNGPHITTLDLYSSISGCHHEFNLCIIFSSLANGLHSLKGPLLCVLLDYCL